MMVSMAALFLGGCADDLSPEVKDKPPGAYSPDPTANLPQFDPRAFGQGL
jgi:hypothetical protein